MISVKQAAFFISCQRVVLLLNEWGGVGLTNPMVLARLRCAPGFATVNESEVSYGKEANSLFTLGLCQ